MLTAARPPRLGMGLSLRLLAFPILFLGLGLVLLAMARQQTVDARTLTGAGIFAAALIASAIWMRRRLPMADPLLLPIAACLASLGQLMTSRLVPDLGPRQGIWVLAGLFLMCLVPLIPSPMVLRRYRYTAAVLALLLMLVTLVFGYDPNGSGARLWLHLGAFNFQPVEIVKLLVVSFLASYLEDYRELLAMAGRRVGPFWVPPVPYLAPILVTAGGALAVLAVQRDLGPALLISSVMLAMLYMASGRLSYVTLGAVLLLLGGAAANRFVQHVHVRVVIWLDPWANAQGIAYQLVQGLYALASGGIFGTGLDMGSPRYIPAVHTDFIIAAIGEELGLIGTLAVVGLFVLLTVRGFRIALRARSGFNALLAAGLSATIALQALIILSGTMELIPLTGITLPFVSYGGSSVVANFILVGLLLLISHQEEASLRA